MALTSGIAARPQPTLPAALATILSPLLTAPIAPDKTASNTGPGVSYVPSIPQTAATATLPVAPPAPASILPGVSYAPSTPPPAVAEPVAVAPAQDTPPSVTTPSTGTRPTSAPTAQPSLLDLYRDATRTTEAHVLAGFALPAATIAPTPTPVVRTGAELIADAAYTLVAGAGTNRAGIAMLLDSTGAQASEESNRRTPEAKKPSALAA